MRGSGEQEEATVNDKEWKENHEIDNRGHDYEWHTLETTMPVTIHLSPEPGGLWYVALEDIDANTTFKAETLKEARALALKWVKLGTVVPVRPR